MVSLSERVTTSVKVSLNGPRINLDVELMPPSPSTDSYRRNWTTRLPRCHGEALTLPRFPPHLRTHIFRDLQEINPSLGAVQSVQQTVDVGRSLVRSALGETLL